MDLQSNSQQHEGYATATMNGRRLRDQEPAEASTPNSRTKLKLTNKKKGQTDRTWKLWGNDHFDILLAHVEWCVTNKKIFWQDASPLFRKAVGRDYTDKAIRAKLIAECSHYLGKKFDLNALFNAGISYLDLSLEHRDRVKQMASRIHQRGDSSGNDLNGQKTATHEARQDNQNRDILRDRLPHLQMVFPESSSRAGARSDKDDDATREQNTEALGPSRIISQVPNDSTVQPENANGSLNPLNNSQHRSSTVLSGGSIYDQRTGIANMLKRKAGYQFTQEEKSRLENRIFVLENDKTQLTREVIILRKSGPDANASNNLAQQLKSTQDLVNWNKSPYLEVQALNQRSINRKYSTLYSNVRDTCLDFAETDNNLPDPATKFDQLAQSWARRTFCRDLKDCLYSVSKDEFSKEHLIMGLVVAAIFDRVFEPVFPDILNTESAVSYKYREYLAIKDGPDELHRADLYALNSLVDDKESVILAQKEKILERLISKSLECFCNSKGHVSSQKARQQKPNGDYDRLASFGPNVETNKRPSLKLGGVLSSALKMKLDLTLSLTRLRFYFFKPGDLFDETKMVIMEDSVAGGGQVKACLFPALFLAPPRERDLNSDEYIQEHDPRYNTFFVEATLDEVASLELVAHASVLT